LIILQLSIKKLMKNVILGLGALGLSAMAIPASAATVDVATARNAGVNYLLSEGVQGVKSAADLSLVYTKNATINGSTVADYYVFNFANGNGYIMIAADDHVTPVLSFSGESAFNINKMAPDAQWWINGYANQITYVIQHELDAQPGVTAQWNDLVSGAQLNKKAAARTTSVTFPSSTAYLLSTTWDQTPDYNDSCPTGSLGRTVTGCVATAMAQVMKFWSWPSVGTGSHAYYDNEYGIRSANFGNTAYQWSSMPNSISTHNAAIAQLMYHAGVGVNMSYNVVDSDGSGAYVIELESPYTNCAEYALKTYFHYKPTLRGIPRFGESYYNGSTYVYYVDSTPQATWISTIEAELNAQRPVIYSGSGSDGGHCWVCDGYNASNLMHFNFGWSGTSNGFYSVNNIAPPALGTGGGGSGNNFNSDQCIIVGITPDSFANTTGNLKMLSHLNCAYNSPNDYGGAATVTAKILNSGSSTFKGSFCVQVFDTSNKLITTIQTITGETVTAGDSTASLTFSTTGLWALIPEDYYHIECMYQATGTTTWTPIANNGTFINYNIISVEDDTDMMLYDSISVTSGHNHIFIPGNTFTVASSVLNYSNNTFSGTVEGVLINTATGASTTVQSFAGQRINSGYYQNFTFTHSSLALATGLYVFAVKHQYGGTGNFYVTGSTSYENPVYINVVAPAAVETVNNTNGDIVVYPNPATEDLHISLQGIVASQVHILDMQGRVVENITPGSNQDLTIPVHNYVPGIYLVQVQAGDVLITKKVEILK
jgi:Peptidase C10 family/Spi protease inhibitor/Secretion system C-terminal sorting domain